MVDFFPVDFNDQQRLRLTIYPDHAPLDGRCISAIDTPQTYQVSVVPCDADIPLRGPVEIIATCVESFRRSEADRDLPICGPLFDLSADEQDDLALSPVEDALIPELGDLDGPRFPSTYRCRDLVDRPALHTVIVVDSSGSMGRRVGDSERTKADIATAAVKAFASHWRDFLDTGLAGQHPDDRLGVVLFNEGVDYYHEFCGRDDEWPIRVAACDEPDWCIEPDALRGSAYIESGSLMAQVQPMHTDLLCEADDHGDQCDPLCGADGSFPHGGLTSIGSGLLAAIGPDFLDLADYEAPRRVGEGRRNVIVLLTDGEHNTPCDYTIEDRAISFEGCANDGWWPWRDGAPNWSALRDRRRPERHSLIDARTGRLTMTLHTVVIGQSSDNPHRRRMQDGAQVVLPRHPTEQYAVQYLALRPPHRGRGSTARR